MKLLTCFAIFVCSAVAQMTVRPSTTTLLASNAQHPSWCKSTSCGANTIAFHKLNTTTGAYQIWSMQPDGSNQICLSCTSYAQATLPGAQCGASGSTQCQQGNPEWAPNGDIVFEQERVGCTLTLAQTVPGTGLCSDLVECDPAFTLSCKTIAVSGTGSDSGFLQYRFSADGTKLFGGHVTATGTCTAIFGEALAIRIFNWSPGSATQIMYTGPDTQNGDLLPAPYVAGNTCSSVFVEGATTYPTSIEPTTNTLFFSIVGNTTQSFRQYSLNIASGDASTILRTLAVVTPGGPQWSEMGKINSGGDLYAYVSSMCTPDAPPVSAANVALELAILVPDPGEIDGGPVCATTYNTPNSSMYYNKGTYVQFQDFDWGPANSAYSDSVIANVTDIKTFNSIYRFDLGFSSQLNGPALKFGFPVVNSGSYSPVFTSGQWLSIFGENLSTVTRGWNSSDFNGAGLPTSLSGVSVTVNGNPAYIAYVSPGQVNILAPDDGATGPVSVQVTSNGLSSQPELVSKQAFAPTFFIFPAGGGQYIIAVHSNYSLVGSTSLYPGASTPAQAGEEIVLYGTGFGPTSPSLSIGQLITAPMPSANPVSVTIGGVQAAVKFAGVVESGLYQINVVVPSGTPSGDQPVVATVGGVQSQADAYITVQ